MFNRYVNLSLIACVFLGSTVLFLQVINQRTMETYALVFEEPVNGLYVGSEVFVNGIPIGSVKSMDIMPNDYSKSIVLIKTKRINKPELARAEICLRSMAGHYGINIMYAQTPEALSVLNGVAQIKVSISFLHRLRQKLDAVSTDEGMQQITSHVKDALSIMQVLFNEITTTLRNINKLVDNVGPAIVDLTTIVSDSNKAGKTLSSILNEAERLLKESYLPIFLQSDLKNISYVVGDIQRCVGLMKIAMKEFNKHPITFLTRGYQDKRQ